MHHSTAKALANKAAPSPGPAWITVDPQSGPNNRAFRCQTCGHYVMPVASGKLRPHWLHLVGKAKKKLPEYQCKDQATYSTTDTHATPYDERTAIYSHV